ncbi:hypothetical protein KL909_000591 [Ogataea angusta]|nr:hypothetical protein KL909_000591 [Ogataea angusta]KAG7831715.1 hypothetical protein KL920_000050 [Ogataea angusta]KAG7835888.1 hypothetical protein KL943_001537 [Ogataea angusta]KAG7854547.1 hypothetical protein KL939_004820 [Ogataea angusta]
MTGPLTSLLYRLNRRLRELSELLIGATFDPYRDIVLVTGGCGGLGKELVLVFTRAHAPVVVFDVNLPEPEDRVPGVHYYVCDVSDRKDVLLKSAQVAEEVGTITILINNAGITTGKTVLDLSFEEIEKTIEVNLLSSFYTIKAFLPSMLKVKRGYIVTVASTLGYMSPARLSVYGATKSGLIALHESLTYELGPPSFNTTGVKTLLICPGQLKTRMFEGVRTPHTLLAPELEPQDVSKAIFSAIELGKRGEIKLPFYGNFLPIFRAVPWPVVEVARYFSGMDTSMKKFVGKTMAIKESSESALTNAISETGSIISGLLGSGGFRGEEVDPTKELHIIPE